MDYFQAQSKPLKKKSSSKLSVTRFISEDLYHLTPYGAPGTQWTMDIDVTLAVWFVWAPSICMFSRTSRIKSVSSCIVGVHEDRELVSPKTG